jgi:hypothetical protein
MRHAALVLAVVLAVAAMAYSSYVSVHLRGEAVALAAGQPWCLQVAPGQGDADDPAGYRPVRGFFDTLGLRMRGRGAYHHAVLVVGHLPDVRTWHWSYLKNRFVEGSYGWPQHPVSCTTSVDHPGQAGAMPVPVNHEFWFAGIHYSIPRGYRVSLTWPSTAPGLMFAARAPEFAPARDWCEDRLCNFVSAQPVVEGPQALFDSMDGGGRHTTIERGKHQGLESLLVEDGQGTRWRFHVARDAYGNETTAIRCFESDRFQCGHSFVRGRWRFRFHHMPVDLARWREMQDRVAAKMDAFTAGSPP